MRLRTLQAAAVSVTVALVLAGCPKMPGSLLDTDSHEAVVINAEPRPRTAADAARANTDPGLDAAERRQAIGFVNPGSGVFTRRGRAARTADGPDAGRFTLNFQDTDLHEVVKVILTDLLGLNYVVDPSVQGVVTLQTSKPLASDALIPTLEMLLRMNNAALVRHGDVYNIVPREQAIRGLVSPQLGDVGTPLPPEYGVRIAPLRYIGAEEMSNILEPFVAPGNLVRVDKQRNLVILAGTSQELARLLETIDVFDVDWIAGMSVGLFTPDFVDTKTLVAELEKVFGLNANTPLAGMVRFETIERLNALLVVTPKNEHLRTVSDWIERLDRESGALGERLFIYHVQNGKAVELAAILSRLYADETPVPAEAPLAIAPAETPVRAVAAALTRETPAALVPPPAEDGRLAPPPPPVAVLPLDSGLAPVDDRVPPAGATRMRIIADEPNNALLIRATAPRYRQVLAALRRLDIVPLQVLIEATIAEITLTDELQHGLEWFFKNHIGNTRKGTARLDTGLGGLAALAPGFSYAITDAAGAVRAVLNTLASDSRLNVISSPSIMVLNNQEARIQVGDEVPITTQQQQSTLTTANVVNTIEFRDTGVLLAVTPRVNAGGLVIMDVLQEVSDVVPGSGASLTPTIQQRKINSTVGVQSGQTIVLGGLIRENRGLSRSGFPGLVRIPVLGTLFGTTSEDARRTELVVLITPRVVRDAVQAAQITNEFRAKMRSLRSVTRVEGDVERAPGNQEPPGHTRNRDR